MEPLIINIGREESNDWIVAAAQVSGSHAQLLRDEEGNWFINDLHSANGTYVNGMRLTGPVQLKKSDSIQLGRIPFDWRLVIQQKAGTVEKKKKRGYPYLVGLGISLVLFMMLWMLNDYYAG